jgi:hypothetical protein
MINPFAIIKHYHTVCETCATYKPYMGNIAQTTHVTQATYAT